MNAPIPVMDTHLNEKTLFDQAVDLPSADRAAFLGRACGADADLRRAIESLLTAHDRAGRFLADPSIPIDHALGPGILSSGSRIGPYTLVSVLGEGGFGTIYLAEQDLPLRRKVALKVVKAGMDTRQVIARFELERQALALMDHPSIAKVFDAGSTDLGHPYFVMELVDGLQIVEHCRSKQLGIQERLSLFAVVCGAVQHAHQKGIIHRDLKPGNVLVATVDGKPVPKVIDFGIAKALDERMSGGESLTKFPQPLGTPQYMSPEQATSTAAEVDTRTDIYSLGVLLYELLTERPPFDPAQLRLAGFEEILRILREVDPPTPSSRLAMIDRTAAPGDAGTHSDARKLAVRVRGDLDWITMKALEKDPVRRYPTAEALAADIGRYLANEPVLAGPKGKLYRLGKFARRNRGLLAAGASIALALVLGTIAATVGLVGARKERDRAETALAAEARQHRIADQQRARAQAKEAEAKEQAEKLWAAQVFLFHLISPANDPNNTPPPREVVDFVAHRTGDGSLAGHPEVEAPIRIALGRAYLRLTLWEQGENQYRMSLKLHEQVRSLEVQNRAPLLADLAICLMFQDRYDEAESADRESLEIYRRQDNELAATAVEEDLAAVLIARGEPAAAEPLLRGAQDFWARQDDPRHLDVLWRVAQLAVEFDKRGNRSRAQELTTAAESLRKKLDQVSIVDRDAAASGDAGDTAPRD